MAEGNTNRGSGRKPWDDLHRRLVLAMSLLTIVAAAVMIVAPAVIHSVVPDFPLMGKFMGMTVPPRSEPILLVLVGVLTLMEGVLLYNFTQAGFWLAQLMSLVGVVHGLTSLGSFWPTLLNLLMMMYLYSVRHLFVKTAVAGA